MTTDYNGFQPTIDEAVDQTAADNRILDSKARQSKVENNELVTYFDVLGHTFEDKLLIDVPPSAESIALDLATLSASRNPHVQAFEYKTHIDGEAVTIEQVEVLRPAEEWFQILAYCKMAQMIQDLTILKLHKQDIPPMIEDEIDELPVVGAGEDCPPYNHRH